MDIAVIGAGSYGTCLAILLGQAGHQVQLWCRDPALAETLTHGRVNHAYLPGFALPAAVTVTSDLAAAITGRALVVAVTPSHAVRAVLGEVAQRLDPDVILVNASKGLEDGSLATLDEVYRQVLPERIAARATFLSGPTFAAEIAAGMPSAIVLAGRTPDTLAVAQAALSTDRFRVYTTPDVAGVLIGGALKNVIAIAAGVADGLGMGSNARAALITRGLAEITRVGVTLGADALTFAGLSGMGDLVLTCSGEASRNRRVGLALGRGQALAAIMADMRMVAEGVKTTKVAHALTHQLGVDAPIIDVMYRVMYEDLPAADGLTRLMTRALRSERD